MKALLPLLIITICWSSGRNHNPIKDQLSLQTLKELKVFPHEISVDTIDTYDSVRNLKIYVEIPISGIAKLDSAVDSHILNQRDQFLEKLDQMISNDPIMLNTISSMFTTELVSVYNDDHLTSYCFAIDYYTAGAAHGKRTYNSFNYDLSDGEQISFENYFEVRSKEDTLFFLEMISNNLNNEWLSLSDLKTIDFNIEQDTISFNFGDYEIGPYSAGSPRVKIHRRHLENKTNSRYQEID